MTLSFEAGQGATSISGWIYDVDAPTSSGRPHEEFTVPGRTGAHTARSIVPGRTYQVLRATAGLGLQARFPPRSVDS